MTPRELNGRQLTDLGMEGSAVKTCFSSKQLDYINLLTDDATFLLGDTCYVSDINAFGIIRELLTVNKRLYADLQLFGPHTFDSECSIPYAPKTPTDKTISRKTIGTIKTTSDSSGGRFNMVCKLHRHSSLRLVECASPTVIMCILRYVNLLSCI